MAKCYHCKYFNQDEGLCIMYDRDVSPNNPSCRKFIHYARS